MKHVALLVALATTTPPLAGGCAGTTSDPEPPLGSMPTDGSESGAGSSSDDAAAGSSSEGSRGESSSGEAAPAVIVLDRAWLDTLAGAWVGPVDPTPFGAIPGFPLSFSWQEDGSLHARTDNPAGGYFDFRFFEQEGTWVFREEGQLPGGLTQSYVLHPVERAGDRVRFVSLDAPDFLGVDIEVSGTHMTMAVTLMGREHARFELDR